MSLIAWLASSESERRRTLEVIKLLNEPETRDELGIGRIRDALAERLFPGISTIQTRARYLLFVPWTYLELERRSPVADAARRARTSEIGLLQAFRSALSAARETEGLDLAGVIGVRAGERLVQLPSQIYWTGLGTFGIRHFAGYPGTYHRMLAQYDLQEVEVDDDGEPIPGATPPRWDPQLPNPSPSLREAPTMTLSHDEGNYLYERITTNCPGSALAELLVAGGPKRRSKYTWDLAEKYLAALSAQNREVVHQAECFSLVMHGAALLYNHMLASTAKRSDLAVSYADDFAEWAREMQWRHEEIATWKAGIDELWELVRKTNPRAPGLRERDFVEKWTDRALASKPDRLIRDEDAQNQIAAREKRLKGPNARLNNPSALEAWGGASGSGRLSFRWGNAQTILIDIHRGRSRSREGTNDVGT